MVALPFYLLIGTPIFARRILTPVVQKARFILARKRFEKERKALPPAPEEDENGNIR